MSEYNRDNCKQVQMRYNEILSAHAKILERHDEKIDELCEFKSGTAVSIENLVQKIDSLVSTISTMLKMQIGMLLSVAGTGLAFIIWYIQK